MIVRANGSEKSRRALNGPDKRGRSGGQVRSSAPTTAARRPPMPVGALHQLRAAQTGAMKARIAAANQLHSLCDTAPEQVRAQLRPLTFKQKIDCPRHRGKTIARLAPRISGT